MAASVDFANNQEFSNLALADSGLLHGVHAVFSPKNSFTVYGTHRSHPTREPDLSIQYLHEITPKSALYNDYVRKLVNETHSTFLTLNSKIDKNEEDTHRAKIVSISQRYRSALMVCVEEIHDAAKLSNDEELVELQQMFSDIELLWDLVHTLIIDAPSGTRVLYKLLDWIKWHFVFAEKKREVLIQTEEPSQHEEYWDTIIQFLLQGNVPSARSLLSMHRKFNREEFASLDELLKKMPIYSASCGISLNEFRIRWKQWQEECRARLEREEFASDSNLEKICKLLCGDLNVLSEKSNLCKNWYHLMISVLLYTNPCINICDLADTARAYYNNVTSTSWDKSSLVDSVILAAMELDIKTVIDLICSFNDGWWFAAHLTDIFSHSDFIEQFSQNREMKNYRTFLLKNYAETLMSHSSLWQVGTDYLEECKTSCEAYLERIPLKTEAQAKKLLYIARKKNMDSLVKTISNVMTARSIRNGKLGTALTWISYSKDARYADEIADRWLKDYSNSRSLEGLEIFRNMGSCMLVSDKLTFVGKYCEFHKLYADGDLKAASSLLISLLASELAPPNFQMILLLDALPLLESPQLIFTRKDTFQLMECLEETLKRLKKEPIAEQENIIRLALVRNLSRCFIIETEDSDSDGDISR